MGPERKLWYALKRNTPGITWNRIENISLLGMPDLLGYNANRHFFTVELKVVKSNKIRFSPHQIAFHTTHPQNTFILAKHHGQGCLKLFPGSMINACLSEGFACSSVARGSWPTVLARLSAC